MLPMKTSAEDLRAIVDYLKAKPTGVTVDMAKSAVGRTLVNTNR